MEGHERGVDVEVREPKKNKEKGGLVRQLMLRLALTLTMLLR